MRELSLYFHIPYCKSKCHYCDFNSYADKKHTVKEYFECLNKEIQLYKNLTGTKIRTIFIGGGSPSVVRGDYIVRIINECKKHFKLNPNIEISLEANPESLTKQKLIKYRSSGINRLSIGLQAWQDHLLKKIGRIHSKDQFLNAYKIARKVGFTNIILTLCLESLIRR
jgi:oxygen-independent coproporphyrinogen-3 oxidase